MRIDSLVLTISLSIFSLSIHADSVLKTNTLPSPPQLCGMESTQANGSKNNQKERPTCHAPSQRIVEKLVKNANMTE